MSDIAEPLFAASYMKLERAKGFITELDRERLRYLNDNPATVIMELPENEQPRLKAEWKGVGLIPGAIIGDAIHNTRTALDLMATSLVQLKRPEKEAYFPFAEDLEALEKSDKFKTFKHAGQDCADELIKLAPYKGGNLALRALHDLDIHDKHKALIPATQTFNMRIEGSYNIDDPSKHNMSVVMSGLVYLFPDGTALAKQPVIPTLIEFVEMVTGILKTFEGVVAARG